MQQQTSALDDILGAIGQAGRRLSEIDAAEGAAGNLSVCVPAALDVSGRFPQAEEVRLPVNVPELAGASFLVTGSGRRLREILDDPQGNLGCVVVQPGGQSGSLFTSPRRRFTRLTSEFNSHLAAHYDRWLRGAFGLHAVIHAQPPYLTYLSHIAAYQDELFLNRHLLRWQPETIIQMPEGLGSVPFMIPGSAELVEATRAALQQHQLALWSRHGVIARADGSVMHACDLIEYAEAAARYEHLNLAAGEPSEGLSAEQVRAICESVGVRQAIF
jgi:rhamnulose-1-phosphate aldolase